MAALSVIFLLFMIRPEMCSVYLALLRPLQVLTHGGTAPWASSCRSPSWPWSGSWWRTTTTPPKMTLWASSRCLSPACGQVLTQKLTLHVLPLQNSPRRFQHVCSLFSGYRHVHLLKADGSSLSPATLFIHVKVTRKGIPLKTVSERLAKSKPWQPR